MWYTANHNLYVAMTRVCFQASVTRMSSFCVCRFDGEAMVHAVYFAGGRALSYQNHWLRAPRFLLERAAGTPLWPRVRLRFFRITGLRCKHSMRFSCLLLALDRLAVLVLYRRKPVSVVLAHVRQSSGQRRAPQWFAPAPECATTVKLAPMIWPAPFAPVPECATNVRLAQVTWPAHSPACSCVGCAAV